MPIRRFIIIFRKVFQAPFKKKNVSSKFGKAHIPWSSPAASLWTYQVQVLSHSKVCSMSTNKEASWWAQMRKLLGQENHESLSCPTLGAKRNATKKVNGQRKGSKIWSNIELIKISSTCSAYQDLVQHWAYQVQVQLTNFSILYKFISLLNRLTQTPP